MPGSPEKIPEEHFPSQESDVREYWRALVPLCKMHNAWLNAQVRGDSGKEDLKFSDSNVVLEYIRGAGGTGNASSFRPPFTVEDASAASSGGSPHPGRVRVYAGRLCNRRATGMNIPDAVLPNGADNRFYLTMQAGQNYVYGKVAVNATTGLPGTAEVYRTASEELPSGTHIYLPIAVVALDDNGMTIEQISSGNQSAQITCTPDGTILTADWSLQGIY